jgi:hypothetical protein
MLHTMYIMPDAAFVWYDTKIVESVPRVLTVQTRSQTQQADSSANHVCNDLVPAIDSIILPSRTSLPYARGKAEPSGGEDKEGDCEARLDQMEQLKAAEQGKVTPPDKYAPGQDDLTVVLEIPTITNKDEDEATERKYESEEKESSDSRKRGRGRPPKSVATGNSVPLPAAQKLEQKLAPAGGGMDTPYNLRLRSCVNLAIRSFLQNLGNPLTLRCWDPGGL